jgi:hypothetical protein
MRWLVISVGLSIVLTVVVNVVLRAFPDAGQRLARGLNASVSRAAHHARQDDRRVGVVIPWKAMVIGSVILTIVLNVLLRLG